MLTRDQEHNIPCLSEPDSKYSFEIPRDPLACELITLDLVSNCCVPSEIAC